MDMKIVEQFYLGWDGKTRKVNTYGICADEKAARLLVRKLIDETFPKEDWICKKLNHGIWKITDRRPNPAGIPQEQFICIKSAVVLDCDMIRNSRAFTLDMKLKDEIAVEVEWISNIN